MTDPVETNPTKDQHEISDGNFVKDAANVDVTPTDDQQVEVAIGEETFILSQSATESLQDESNSSLQEIEAAKSNLNVIYKRRQFLGQLHITGDYSCLHSEPKESTLKELNLQQFSTIPVQGHRGWKKGERDCPMPISEFIEKFFCSQCKPKVLFWHKQRRIFLSEFAEKVSLQSISQDDFQRIPSQGEACDLCGTPESGTWIVNRDVEVYQQGGPYKCCLTCRDLLIEHTETLPFSPLGPDSHPATDGANEIYSVEQVLTDPYRAPEENEIRPHAGLRGLGRGKFEAVVSNFTGVSDGTAERLYDNGFDSIPGLVDASKNSLTEITFVGKATAEKIQAQAKRYLEKQDEQH